MSTLDAKVSLCATVIQMRCDRRYVLLCCVGIYIQEVGR